MTYVSGATATWPLPRDGGNLTRRALVRYLCNWDPGQIQYVFCTNKTLIYQLSAGVRGTSWRTHALVEPLFFILSYFQHSSIWSSLTDCWTYKSEFGTTCSRKKSSYVSISGAPGHVIVMLEVENQKKVANFNLSKNLWRKICPKKNWESILVNTKILVFIFRLLLLNQTFYSMNSRGVCLDGRNSRSGYCGVKLVYEAAFFETWIWTFNFVSTLLFHYAVLQTLKYLLQRVFYVYFFLH